MYQYEVLVEDGPAIKTYNSWNSELVLLSVVEELQDIVSDNDTGLAGQDILGTHIGDWETIQR